MDGFLFVIAFILWILKMCCDSSITVTEEMLEKLYIKKDDFNSIFGDESYYVFFLYMIKPFFAHFVSKCRGVTNQSYFAYEVFFFRLAYDLFFLVSACMYLFDDAKINLFQFVLYLGPCMFQESMLYVISVRPGNNKARKIQFRMVKINVRTQ